MRGSRSAGLLVPAAVALLLFLAAVAWALAAQRGAGDAGRLLTETYEFMQRQNGLSMALVDAETGQRGFLLSGDERYLEPYEAALPRITGQLADILSRAGGTASRPDGRQELARLVAAKLDALRSSIDTYRTGEVDGVAARLDEGKRIMDLIRRRLVALQVEEREVLAERLARLERRASTATGALALAGVSALALGGCAGGLLLREARTGRRLAEGELDRRTAQIRSVFAAAPVGLAFVDRDLRYVDVNDRMAEINGIPTRDHIGRTIGEALPGLASIVAEQHRCVLETGERLRDQELRAATPADPERPRDWIASYEPVRNSGGEVDGVVAAVVDVTALKRAEAAVRALNQELEARVEERTGQLQEIVAELDAFAYTISHDLRAPLRAMDGFAKILLEEHAEALGQRGRRYAQRIVDAARRMDELIQDLLAYSRLSRVDIELARIDLDRVVAGALTDILAGAGDPKPDVAVDGPLPSVRASRPILGQVVTNLLTNAVKFVAPGERARVRVRAERYRGRVRLWVEDEGIGLAPEHQARIFNVFERLHGQESYPGTGIGLAIVRKGAERMGGVVGVESDGPKRGSRFWVELASASGDEETT